MSVPASTFLRRVLALDAVSSGAMGALLIFAVAPLSSLLSLPASLLTWAGVSLLPFAAFVGWLSTCELPPRGALWAVIAINVFWAVASLLLLTADGIEPTFLGKTFVVFQALVVALYGELQFFGLRRTRRLAAT
jgi:hypothetical protein